ncbi:MAG: urease accessory UreF family protein [Pseudomonadota bacterium]
MTSPVPSSPDLRLASWLSPAFPIGGFSYSQGLEQAVAEGWVPDTEALGVWLDDCLRAGPMRSDAIVLAAAWRAEATDDAAALAEAAEMARALTASRERRQEILSQGRSFAAAYDASWSSGETSDDESVAAQAEPPYPIALGRAAAREGCTLGETLRLFLHAAVSNQLSAAIRLTVTGQTGAQTLLVALLPEIETVAASAEQSTLDDVGSATLRLDIASMRHETLQTRLFQS